MWIVPWDPFLMKKLLKSVICGSVNSARIYCSLWKVNICGYCPMNSNRITPKCVKTKKKKKKRTKTQLQKRNAALSGNQTHTYYLWEPYFFKTIFSLQIRLIWANANMWTHEKWFLSFYFFHGNQTKEMIAFLLISFLLLSLLAF